MVLKTNMKCDLCRQKVSVMEIKHIPEIESYNHGFLNYLLLQKPKPEYPDETKLKFKYGMHNVTGVFCPRCMAVVQDRTNLDLAKRLAALEDPC